MCGQARVLFFSQWHFLSSVGGNINPSIGSFAEWDRQVSCSGGDWLRDRLHAEGGEHGRGPPPGDALIRVHGGDRGRPTRPTHVDGLCVCACMISVWESVWLDGRSTFH